MGVTDRLPTLEPLAEGIDHVRGEVGAPVILEYGDYECPFSRRAFRAIERVEREVPVRFALRHYPLTQIHPHAQAAATAAEAAARQDRFWEMHDLLFENQQALGLPLLVESAEALGLSSAGLRQALANGDYAPKVQADFLGGVRSGVNGTPTFFVNGHRYDGSWEPRPFLAALNALREDEPDPLL
jgi:protein-disulfide isomerase